jgi:hypothetical protein
MKSHEITVKTLYRPASIHFAYIPEDGCIDAWEGCREHFHDYDDFPENVDDFEDIKQFAAYLPSPEPEIIFKNVKTIIGVIEKSLKLRRSRRLEFHLIDALPIGKSKRLKPYAGNQKVMIVDLPKFWRRELQQNLLTALIRAANYTQGGVFLHVQEINETNFWNALEQSGYFSGHCKRALERFMAGNTRFKGYFDGWVDTFDAYNGNKYKKLAKEKK